ncbi:dihydroorotate dehydrogenase electron transfer subunit [candidate division KSB1 bacterium]|nr:dihydroorotate dehydrogenase electron transfer subunit [candidate division KSB1 bacterium]RQW10731.1 MAG: dihydroorotate dehydrogenase electron transfer subunit [candidate division KSB1 bacterium]
MVRHCTIRSVDQVARNTYLLSFEDADLCRVVRAGQFLEIKVTQCTDILWRRPFSIHDTHPQKNTVDILFHAVGPATRTLAQLTAHAELNILGPLGNYFRYEQNVREAIVVAGGLGIAPFMLMMRELQERGIAMRLFYGTGRSDQFCRLEEFEKYAALHLSTVDGSRGYQGVVTDMLSDYLDQSAHHHDSSLYVCGPTAMLRAVKEIANRFNMAAQVSVETIMACGFGACVGCAVPMTTPIPGQKYFMACKDGPVFDIREITIDD